MTKYIPSSTCKHRSFYKKKKAMVFQEAKIKAKEFKYQNQLKLLFKKNPLPARPP